MNIYYAHPMSWYDTDREKDDIAAIAEFGPGITVINPNTAPFHGAVTQAKADGRTGQQIMDIFLKAVIDADALAYRTFDDGYLSSGVAHEVFVAYLYGRPIYQIIDAYKQGSKRNGLVPKLFEQQTLRAAFGPRVMNITDTRDRIHRRIM